LSGAALSSASASFSRSFLGLVAKRWLRCACLPSLSLPGALAQANSTGKDYFMKTKIALSLIAAALIAGCTSTPTWNTSVFPNEVVYSAASAGENVAEVPK
jgi:hypothetical protein